MHHDLLKPEFLNAIKVYAVIVLILAAFSFLMAWEKQVAWKSFEDDTREAREERDRQIEKECNDKL